MASERCNRAPGPRGLHPRKRAPIRLPACVHARFGQSRALSKVRPLGPLSRRYVSAHGSGDGADGIAADELPPSNPDLQAKMRSYRDLPVRIAELGTMY